MLADKGTRGAEDGEKGVGQGWCSERFVMKSSCEFTETTFIAVPFRIAAAKYEVWNALLLRYQFLGNISYSNDGADSVVLRPYSFTHDD